MAPRVKQFYRGKAYQTGYGSGGWRRAGGGLLIGKNQRGHGIGALFKVLSKVALPLIRKTARIGARTLKSVGKRALKTAGKRALRAGANAMKDVAFDNVEPQKAFKNRAKEIFNPPKSVQPKSINRAQPKRKIVSSSRKSVHNRSRKAKRKVVAPYLT